jgi:hypothetical protein
MIQFFCLQSIIDYTIIPGLEPTYVDSNPINDSLFSKFATLIILNGTFIASAKLMIISVLCTIVPSKSKNLFSSKSVKPKY